MKLISWNVNGLRACLSKGFESFFKEADADVFCVQETKMQPEQAEISFEGYHQYWNSAEKKGYSGTAVFSRELPLSASYGIGIEQHGSEGRVITLEYERFYLVNCYTPNAQAELARIGYRMQWEDDFRAYLQGLDTQKPVIACGDLNVAHNVIDIKHAKPNIGNAGFSYEERGKMTELLASGFVDTFRHLHPDVRDAYTWWSYMFNARTKNVGWRIDYFLVSERLKDCVTQSCMHPDIMGSDHCPVELVIF